MGFLWESINGRPLMGREKRGLGDKSYIEKLKIGLGIDFELPARMTESFGNRTTLP
jgi:hypothetical protein